MDPDPDPRIRFRDNGSGSRSSYVVILSLLFRYIKQNNLISFLKNYILIISVDLYVSLSRFIYPDPDQRFLKWIRIQPNDTDPTGSGSGSETLDEMIGD